MNQVLKLVIVAVLYSATATPTTATETIATETSPTDETKAPAEPKGMRSIFNGRNLDGWAGDPRLWSVQGGVIRGETTKANRANGNTFLIWKAGKTKDFQLRLSFKVSSVNNSGIQYRSKHITDGKPRNPWVVRGYQHEIRNSDKMPNVAGFIYEEGGKRGRMCLAGERTVWDSKGKRELRGNVITPEEFAQLFKVDEFNDVVIVAQGNHLRHFMNGRLILDCTDNHPTGQKLDGILAFQLHAGAPMWVEFKNIRIKEEK
ncbi:MAG: DUF1080 domain-containing protein [Planctomycetota bacterium]|nr:DUF1080 domain-containing protein [Planctomycetota bacterium]